MPLHLGFAVSCPASRTPVARAASARSRTRQAGPEAARTLCCTGPSWPEAAAADRASTGARRCLAGLVGITGLLVTKATGQGEPQALSPAQLAGRVSATCSLAAPGAGVAQAGPQRALRAALGAQAALALAVVVVAGATAPSPALVDLAALAQ